MEYLILVYMLGFIASMIIIFITDRSIYKRYARTTFASALLYSFFSIISVLFLIIMLIYKSDIYNRVDNLWRYGKFKTDEEYYNETTN